VKNEGDKIRELKKVMRSLQKSERDRKNKKISINPTEIVEINSDVIYYLQTLGHSEYLRCLIMTFKNTCSSKNVTEILSFIETMKNAKHEELKDIFCRKFEKGSFFISNKSLHHTSTVMKTTSVIKGKIQKREMRIMPIEQQRKKRVEIRNNVSKHQKKLKSSLNLKENNIKRIYKVMKKVAQELSADGGPTNADLTFQSIESIIQMCVRHGLTKNDVWGDAGCAVNTVCCHISHKIGCRSIGYELVPNRVYLSCNNFLKALQNGYLHEEKVATFHCNLFDINTLEHVTWLYMFDEAFDANLIDHIINLCVKSDIRYIVSFKCSKESSFKNNFATSGFEIVDQVKTFKCGSSEGNTAYLFKRKNDSKKTINKEMKGNVNWKVILIPSCLFIFLTN